MHEILHVHTTISGEANVQRLVDVAHEMGQELQRFLHLLRSQRGLLHAVSVVGDGTRHTHRIGAITSRHVVASPIFGINIMKRSCT